MADRLELLLEAESRGILPPERQAALNEARRRGLVAPLPESGIREQGIGTMAVSGASGFTEGLANVLGLPVDLANMAVSPIIEAMGGTPSEAPFLGSQNILAGIRALGGAVGTEDVEAYLGRPQTAAERIAGRTGQEIGAGAAGALPLGIAARGARLAAPTTPAATTLGEISRQAVQQAAQRPGAVALGELGLATAGGAAAGAAREAFPGQPGVEMMAQMAPTVVPAAAIAATRGALRGGEAGREAIEETLQTFGRAGVEPTVGQAALPAAGRATTIETTAGTIPGGYNVLRRTAEQQQTQLQQSVENLARRLGPELDNEQAGRLIQEGLTGEGGFADRVAARAEGFYNQLGRYIPSDRRVSVAATNRALNELTTPVAGAEATSAQFINPRIRTIADNFAADIGPDATMPYEAVSGLRSLVGRELAPAAGRQIASDIPTAQLERLYAALSRDMEGAAQAAGPEAVRAFRRANNFYRATRNQIRNVLDPLVKKRTAEEVFRAVDQGGKQGATTIRNIYGGLTRDQRRAVSGAVLRRLGQPTPGVEAETPFSMNRFLTNWNRLSPNARNALFSGGSMAEFRRDLDAVADTARRIREGAQVLANPSGTAPRLSSAAGGAAIGAGFFEPSILLGALGAMGGSAGTASLMTSPRFVRWLAQGTRIPASRLPAHIGRLMPAMKDATEEELTAAQEYISALKDATTVLE